MTTTAICAVRKAAKKFLCCLAAILILCTAMPVPSHAVDVSATAAILVDATAGKVLYEKNADRQMLIASTTKIMTCLIALRDGVLSDVVTVSREAAGTEGSSMYLRAGEKVTLEALLYGLMLPSGNDAAVAIAQHLAGSVPEFAKRMNEMAQSLGMTNSSFANPHGLNQEGHYSTARDMARLADAAMNHEILRRITSTVSITIAGRTMTNHNKLLNSLEGCIGLKTGYTQKAGRTLVTCVERDGRRLICVTLQDGNDWVDHRALYEYGFSTPATPAASPAASDWIPAPNPDLKPSVYSIRPLAGFGDYMGEAPVDGGWWGTVPLMAGEDFYALLTESDEVRVWIALTEYLQAPIRIGQRAGDAIYYLDGEEIGRIPILCSESIPVSRPEGWSSGG